MREAMMAGGASVAQVGAGVTYVRRRWGMARVLRGLAIVAAAGPGPPDSAAFMRACCRSRVSFRRSSWSAATRG